jgi:hypothetical protein
MNTINVRYRKAMGMLMIMIASAGLLQAQDQQKDKDLLLKDLIASKQYIFNAESVLPSTGRLRLLNSGERLEIFGDSLTVDLPYFGRAYSAPIDPSNGGFHFTSADYEYTLKEKKKGGWNILIKPKDNRDVQQLILDISSESMASLQVISNNRQSISFNGHIKERNKTVK